MKSIDLTGQTFGSLLVMDRAGKDKYKKLMWKCKCLKCGTETVVCGNNLRTGHTKSCGNKFCSGRALDITGMIFNKLRVIRFLGNHQWDCECQCGRHVQTDYYSLKNNVVKSCGYVECGGRKQDPLQIGEQFWFWTVIGKAEEKHNSSQRYCRCRCGTTKDVAESSLRQGVSKSCGCIKSFGEETINRLLNKFHINYKSQWNNDKQMRLSNNNPVFFDYAIYSDINDDKPVFCLEYNGEQHYIYKKTGWNTVEHFLRTQERDNEKIVLCQECNIPLEIISYKDYKNLETILIGLLKKYNLLNT